MLTALLAAALVAQAPDFDKETLPPGRGTPKTHINGKSIDDLLAAVKKEWPTIVFEKDGKKVNYVVKLETDDGDIEVEFFPDKAPIHVRSFIALAKAGFFNGVKFHRAIPEFVIQGGCPMGTGMGGPGYNLKAEFNSTPHDKGILSMARANDPDSAGSQFFICLGREATAQLDNKYTVFGKVTKGLDVVDKIAARPNAGRDSPRDPCVVKKATVETK
jgi:peptidyl-prolyl cis-trans isomerase B (cyclophilin B)